MEATGGFSVHVSAFNLINKLMVYYGDKDRCTGYGVPYRYGVTGIPVDPISDSQRVIGKEFKLSCDQIRVRVKFSLI